MTTFVCHNCFEPLSYTGPMDNGNPDKGFAVRQRGSRRAFLFCSEACANWWYDIIGVEAPADAANITIEDGVPVELV